MESFEHEICTETIHLDLMVKVVLQSICFHRLFGTVKPATFTAFGMTLPTVGQGEVDILVQETAQLVQRQTASANRVELVVFFLHPNALADSKIGGGSASPAMGAAIAASSAAANAASSLRAWASPRSYSYNWLAHAFSGGAGQVGGGSSTIPEQPARSRSLSTGTRDALAEKEHTALSANAFERWTIHFTLTSSQDASQGKASDQPSSQSLAAFLGHLLTFVLEHKNHIPAITSATLCPFPLRVLVR